MYFNFKMKTSTSTTFVAKHALYFRYVHRASYSYYYRAYFIHVTCYYFKADNTFVKITFPGYIVFKLIFNLRYFLNGYFHPTFFKPSIVNVRDIMRKFLIWSAYSVEPDQTAWMCKLAWLYTVGKVVSEK
jgi:hypothetical protein